MRLERYKRILYSEPMKDDDFWNTNRPVTASAASTADTPSFDEILKTGKELRDRQLKDLQDIRLMGIPVVSNPMTIGWELHVNPRLYKELVRKYG